MKTLFKDSVTSSSLQLKWSLLVLNILSLENLSHFLQEFFFIYKKKLILIFLFFFILALLPWPFAVLLNMAHDSKDEMICLVLEKLHRELWYKFDWTLLIEVLFSKLNDNSQLNCHRLQELAFQTFAYNASLRTSKSLPQSASSPVILTNKVRDIVSRLWHTSPIKFIFGGGQDKFVLFIQKS